MIRSVEEFHKEFVSVVEDAERLCFAPRAKELQDEALNRINDLKCKATKLKGETISARAEDLANRMLSYEQALEALANELRMWIALKEDRAADAWDCLICAETAARTAIQAHSISKHLAGYLRRLQILENLLFPPMTFLSIGALVTRSLCSICGEEYGECDHLKGCVYMGEFCAQEIHEGKILETSIVERPANKHCRVTAFTENGITRDPLTWRVIKEKM